MLTALSHLSIESLSMRCGYPASSLKERIYADRYADRYGLLIYTESPDAEGTLGGLVQQARHIEDHLAYAFHTGALCSNDPICAQHEPGESIEGRWLHGAACHGCSLVAETCCECATTTSTVRLSCPSRGHGCCVFPVCVVMGSLLDLPSHLRQRLANAVEAGLLAGTSADASIALCWESRKEV